MSTFQVTADYPVSAQKGNIIDSLPAEVVSYPFSVSKIDVGIPVKYGATVNGQGKEEVLVLPLSGNTDVIRGIVGYKQGLIIGDNGYGDNQTKRVNVLLRGYIIISVIPATFTAFTIGQQVNFIIATQLYTNAVVATGIIKTGYEVLQKLPNNLLLIRSQNV